MSMVTDDSQVEWLVRRARVVFNEWPGPVELRALFCSKWRPADGVEAYSQIYRATENGGGFPSEASRTAPQLPIGRDEARKMIEGLKAHPSYRIQAAERKVEVVVRRITAPAPKPTHPQITQADIDRAEKEYREKKLDAAAKAELTDAKA